MIYFIIYLVIFGVCAYCVDNLQNEKKSKVLTYGIGFIASLFVSGAIAFIVMKLNPRKSTNTPEPVKTVAAVAANQSPKYQQVKARCDEIFAYFRKAGVPYVQDVKDPKSPKSLFETGTIAISGDGILSGDKPGEQMSFICSQQLDSNSGDTITFMGSPIVDQSNISGARASIEKILFFDTMDADAKGKLKTFLDEKLASVNASSYSDWIEITAGQYNLRLMTVQSDSSGNFTLTYHMSIKL